MVEPLAKEIGGMPVICLQAYGDQRDKLAGPDQTPNLR
jgi:hypothetical protein